MAVLAICYQSRDELSCSILDMHLNGVHKMHIIQDGKGWKNESCFGTYKGTPYCNVWL